MISRFAIAGIAIGLLILVGGIFLSEGYSARQGFLGSLPRMKVRLSADERYPQFSVKPQVTDAAENTTTLAAAVELEEAQQLYKILERRADYRKSGLHYTFEGWAIRPGTTIPLGPTLFIASAIIIVSAAVLLGLLFQRRSVADTTSFNAAQSLPTNARLSPRHEAPEPSPQATRSRLRMALHLWGGVCLKAAADVSGVTFGSAVVAGLTAALLVIAGYFLSRWLVAGIDRATMAPQVRTTILVLLPIAYFLGTVLIGGTVALLLGAS